MSISLNPVVKAENLAKKVLGNIKKNEGGKIVEPISKNKTFPIWPTSSLGIPNAFLRSALFGIRAKNKKRTFFDDVTVASLSNYTIKYTGPELDQLDLDIFEQIIELLIEQKPLNKVIYFSQYSFLKNIKRDVGSSQYKELKRALKRLASAIIEIDDGNIIRFDGLIQNGEYNHKLRKYALKVTKNILSVYRPNSWSQVSRSERMQMKGQHLAQWLHGFYSSHAKPRAIKVKTIHTLCRSHTKKIENFRYSLKLALNRLSSVTNWSCYIDETDKVIIIRKPTRSQAKHLKQKGLIYNGI